jgi:hypothetical protein
MSWSGYTYCSCRDCFNTAIADDTRKPVLCEDCEDASCDDSGASECACDNAYSSAGCSCNGEG